MRIAVVTIYSAFNYGSFLQAYAMQETLKKLGHEAVLLDCSKEPWQKKIRKFASRKKPLFTINRYVSYKKDWNKLNLSRNTQEQFDVALIGSDEVWNIRGSFEQWPQYFGNQLHAKRLVAYAPSVGFSKPEELLSSKRFTEGVMQFDAICPRDMVTRDVCSSLSTKVTERVVDPTILLLEDWEHYLLSSKGTGKYVVYYSYLDDSPMKEYILRFAKERNLKVIIAGFDYTWGDENRMVSPLEFMTLLKNAEYIFTSTFHGSVLSTILQKKLVVRPSGQKVTDYLETIGLSERCFVDEMKYDAFEDLAMASIDYKAVREKQKKMKEKSIEILQKALTGE